MWNPKVGCGLVSMLILATACSSDQAGVAPSADPSGDIATQTAEAATSAAEDAAATVAPQDATDPYPSVPFDPESVPLSEVAMGEFPFVGLPAGYAPINRPYDRTFARFPYWLGTGHHWVEGRTWSAAIGVDRNDRSKTFSSLELRRNLDGVVQAAGGRLVFEGEAPPRAFYHDSPWGNEIGGGFHSVVNSISGKPLVVYVIRQRDRQIWIQYADADPHATLVVTESSGLPETARWTDTFPYLQPPAGYEFRRRPEQRDFDRIPFWTGTSVEWVEGRTWHSRVSAEDRRFSIHELRRELEVLIEKAGGQLVFDGIVPREEMEKIDPKVIQTYSDGGGYRWQEPIRVYRVQRDGKELWIQARSDYKSGGWIVAEREGFMQSAGLLPASQLRQKIEADGRVALQVNFATDKAEILPESMPQIEQVIELLRADPTLSLAIEGHTDASGDVARNQTLSEARARSVVAALTQADIDAARLTAAGFGQDRPVDDNTTEDGRAKNRRVELVRRGAARGG